MASAAPVAAHLVPQGSNDALTRWVEFAATGGITLLLLPIAWWLPTAFGRDEAEYAVSAVAFYGAFLINDPHFAVTYLLFYRDARARALGDVFSRAQRLRYWFAGFVAPALLVVWALFALGQNSGPLLGAMIQTMFLLVGWHYTKQGFGVLSVLSARRGVFYSKLERFAVLGHCYAGWAYAWTSPASPSFLVSEKGVVYTQLAKPEWLEATTLGVFAVSSVVLVAALVRKVLREKRLPTLGPLFGLLITVWLWVAFSNIDPILVYLIPALHSVQYLYFVWLLERNRAREEVGPPSFKSVRSQLLRTCVLSILLGWLLFAGAPGFLDETIGRTYDSPGGLGLTPFFAALTTIVNVHHYLMDFVIWRRDHPEAAYLFR
jgi:hypothetical protein